MRSFESLERSISREPDPQPRPARRLLRARGPGERRPALRELPAALPRGREPAASLGPRRLADLAVAAAAGSQARPGGDCTTRSRRSRAGRSSTTSGAASSPPSLVLVLIAGLVRCCSPPWFWTLVVAGDQPVPAALAIVDGGLAQAGRPDHGLAPPRRVRSSIGRDLAQTGLMLIFLPYEAYSNLDAVVRTVVRMSLDAHPPSGMDDVERGRADLARGPARRHHPGDGDRTGARDLVLAVGLGFSRPEALATAAPWLVACGSSRRSSHGGSAGPQPEAR